jgi:hypothetical protein
LLKIAAALMLPDGGRRFAQPGATIRYLPLEPDLSGYPDTHAYVEAGLTLGDDAACAYYLLGKLGLSGVGRRTARPSLRWGRFKGKSIKELSRERFFMPRLRFKSYEEMNVWLLDQCLAYVKTHRHPELQDRTIWSVFEEERSHLVPYAGAFDAFHAVPASVSKTCLVRSDSHKYSVAAKAVGRPVEVHAFADKIAIRQDGEIVATHLVRSGMVSMVLGSGLTT